MFGRTWHLPHWGSDQPHPQRRQIGLIVLAALLLATIALLLLPPHARGNFVYWTNGNPGTSIGRAKINGAGANNNFITGLNDPQGVAVDSKFIYWAEQGGDTIGRANLDGSGVNHAFIPTSAGIDNPSGIAVTSTAIFWGNNNGAADTIGRANLDGTSPVPNFITTDSGAFCGLEADSNFVYYSDQTAGDHIGRAPISGGAGDPSFVTGINVDCLGGVDSSFIYWNTDGTIRSIGRATIAGTGATNNFIPNATSAGSPGGVAINSQYVFWGNELATAIGRANINGSSPNPTLVPGASSPVGLAAAPSNKITINSITRKKKKGTATINAKVPGPGQVTLNQVNTPPDVNATAAAVKEQGLTITAASSFKLAVKPTGKTAKKLKKQVQKKGKGNVKVKVFIHFVPAGVAGVPNTDQLTVKLVKKGKKKT